MGSGASKHRRELRRVQAVVRRTRCGTTTACNSGTASGGADALREEVAIPRKRCGDSTHGDVEKDVAERGG